MHTHYQAVCDTHKERCEVLVTSTFHLKLPTIYECPINTETLDQAENRASNEKTAWLDAHSGCSLRLVHRDDQIELLHDEYHLVGQGRCWHCVRISAK